MFQHILEAWRPLAVVCALLASGACQPYQPPAGPVSTDNKAVVSAGYDQTWTALIDYVAQSTFTIQNFEKDSGLMVLGFAPDNRSQYIDCGTWTSQNLLGRTVPYVDRRGAKMSLRGSKINLRVRELSPDQTSILVNAIYQLRDKRGNYWEFTSNQPTTSTVTSGNQRTCRSKNVAEGQIIRDIQALTFR